MRFGFGDCTISSDEEETFSLPILSHSNREVAENSNPDISDVIRHAFLSDEDSDPEIVCLPSRNKALRNDTTDLDQSVNNPLTAEVVFLEKHFKHLKQSDHTISDGTLSLREFLVHKKSTGQLESLHKVATCEQKGTSAYSLSGILYHQDGTSQEVEEIDIWHVSIDDLANIGGGVVPCSSKSRPKIYIETFASSAYNCHYLLETPIKAYGQIYNSFQWLVDFLKYISDYLLWATTVGKKISLWQFHTEFCAKLHDWHGRDSSFLRWFEQCGAIQDFREHLTSPHHTKFIYYTIGSIRDTNEDLLDHPLWNEIGCCKRPVLNKAPRTLVTDHIADCFLASFPKWGFNALDIIERVTVQPEIVRQQKQRIDDFRFDHKASYPQEQNFETHDNKRLSKAALLLERAGNSYQRIKAVPQELVGKAIVVHGHAAKCSSRPCDCQIYSFALVRSTFSGDVRVRWLELPQWTICAGRRPNKKQNHLPFYPIGNELFLSDRCSCATVSMNDIVDAFPISINTDHAGEESELFVHRRWVAADDSIQEFHDSEIDSCTSHDDPESLLRPENLRSILGSEHLATVSLFSGCGMLDHGFERGSQGCFRSKLAVELDLAACLSWKANRQLFDECDIQNIDVNHIFKLICEGDRPYSNYKCLIAGCPCQGFSRRNANKTTRDSQQQCSLLAHTLSWIELFRPPLVLIENVEGMDETRPSALGQAICCLVSLGYQTRTVHVKASEYGAATSRARLFIVASAPGIPLPALPDPTHGDIPRLLPMTTTSSVTTDLGTIDNDTLLNPRHPSHVPTKRVDPLVEGVISKIPRVVLGGNKKTSNIADALPHLSSQEKAFYRAMTDEQKKPRSGTLRRVHPNRPFDTITTHLSEMDSRSPGVIHWLQDRVLSLLETARFQGVRKDFFLIGSISEQHKQLGNSVESTLAHLWGASFTTAWRGQKVSTSINRDGDDTRDELIIEELSDDNTSCPSPTKLSWKGREINGPLSRTDDAAQTSQLWLSSGSSDTDDYTQLIDTLASTPKRNSKYQNALDDSSDGLPELNELLTPSRRYSKDPILPRRSRCSTKTTLLKVSKSRSHVRACRRRSSSSSDGDSETGPSPPKKLQMDIWTRASPWQQIKPAPRAHASPKRKYRINNLSQSDDRWNSLVESEGVSPASAIMLESD